MTWCARLGSNQQPLPSEGSTLSIELRARLRDVSGCYEKSGAAESFMLSFMPSYAFQTQLLY
jgi:hypothetical protein